MSLLQTYDLAIGYGTKQLASSLNLTIEPGQLIGLIGQNGVGKSTLMRTLAGFQKALNGGVHIDRLPLINYKPNKLAQKISVVLTEKPSAQNLTVLELITLGRHPYSGWLGQLTKEDIDIMERAFEQCQIHYLLDKRLHQLSDGQLQKVMIARALAQDTELILLDEPTSHLDLRNKVEVLELLKEISLTGKSVLISTHEITLAAKVCDLFWGMDFGKPIQVGNPTTQLESGLVAEILRLKDGIL
jgi:iron complex transport system ATP-binding protein